MSVPYERATGGENARKEITAILRRFGCESIGFMDDYENHEVLLAFRHRNRSVQLRASAKGWAALYLREHPHSSKSARRLHDYEQAALQQGERAVSSVLRDWVKGQVTAIECGVLTFEAVFMPYLLTKDGRTLHERGDLMGSLGGSLAIEGPQEELGLGDGR